MNIVYIYGWLPLTNAMDEKNWKKKNKHPMCTQAPWYKLLPYEHKDSILRKIKQETINEYGYSMEECPKREECAKGDKCIGRPLPWKSKTAKPYLDKLKLIKPIKNNELYVTSCGDCPIRAKCTKVCIEINDYINRGKTREPKLTYKDNIDNFTELEQKNIIPKGLNKLLTVPWDILSSRKRQIVELYIHKRRDFKHIADLLDLNNQARVKYEFYSALTKLSEYATMREFLKKYEKELNEKQLKVLRKVYIDNNTKTKTAEILNISKQAIQQTISRVVNQYSIKWKRFVRKKGNRTIYNTIRIFRE